MNHVELQADKTATESPAAGHALTTTTTSTITTTTLTTTTTTFAASPFAAPPFAAAFAAPPFAAAAAATPAAAAAAFPLPIAASRSSRSAASLPDNSARELWEIITPQVAQNTLVRLAAGYPADRTAKAVPAATSNSQGCWLAACKARKGGHCALRPLFPRSGTRVPDGSARTKRRAEQYVHRMAIVAWHPPAALEMLLFGDGGPQTIDASHLCHNAACFTPSHLVVERHGLNERRKAHCSLGRVCRCGSSPQCIF